jgi:MYXO-CTERM domain-containing protein
VLYSGHIPMSESTRGRLFTVVAFLAVSYAALACLHTVGDFDLGWQLATGRYQFQHHTIPAVEVLSYTAAGTPWHYPPFSASLLYAIYKAFGYAGLTWLCVAASVVLTVYVLERAVPGKNLAVAMLLVLAAPSLAYRLAPRADLFTTVFFGVMLCELWRFHCGQKARLWLLPVVMLLWVNLHPGFIAGLDLLGAYLLMEALELPFAKMRAEAIGRLRRAWPWLAVAAAALLVNPWGGAAFRQAQQLTRIDPSLPPVGESTSVRLSWHLARQALDVRDPDSSFCWLLGIAAVALLLALRRRHYGAGLILGLAMVSAIQRLRYQGLFSIVVTVIGGTLLAEAGAEIAERLRARTRDGESRGRAWSVVECSSVALMVALGAVTVLRIADLVTNRYYVVSSSITSFGAGESGWFPERAAAFIEAERLPGNIFQPINIGGFSAFRLGPGYPNYIDGRFDHLAPEIFKEEDMLLQRSPDSPEWRQIAERRNINVILLSLPRQGFGGLNLNAYCSASAWRPIYLDDVSMVLLRRTPQNQPWVDRLEVNCQSAPLRPPANATKIESYNYLANSGAVLYVLARDAEAERAWRGALELEPDDPNIHLFLAQLYQQEQKPAEAEREFRAALRGRESMAAWYGLGRLLAMQHRYAEAEQAIAKAIPMAPVPVNQYKALAQVQLRLNKTGPALANLLEAERIGPTAQDGSPSACEFRAQVAEGRAEAARQAGELGHALEYQQKAVRQTPQQASRWRKLAELANSAGQTGLARDAMQRALSLEAAPK